MALASGPTGRTRLSVVRKGDAGILGNLKILESAPPDFLAGIRVVDLGQYLPGPYAAQILADLGADVVKVEPPDGDPFRHMPPCDADGLSMDYRAVNAGKSVVFLDLKSSDGRDALAGLLASADVLIESYRPDVLDRLEFPRERILSLNPELIHISLTGWGRTGPYRDRPGHDINYMALGGCLTATGTAATPAVGYPPTADHAAGLQAALAAVTALFGRMNPRAESAGGQHIDLSIMESVLAWQTVPLNAVLSGHPPERRYEVLNGGAACYQVYRTSDARYITLGALEAKFWANFCNALGRPEWIDRQWERVPQRDLIGEVGDVLRSRPLDEWVERLGNVDCCFEPVWPVEDLSEHPHIQARGMLRQKAGAHDGLQVLNPLRVDGAKPAQRSPMLETDAASILADWRGDPSESEPAPKAQAS